MAKLKFIKNQTETLEQASDRLIEFAQKSPWDLQFELIDGQYFLASNLKGERPIGIEIDRELLRHETYFKSHSLAKEVLAKSIGIRSGKRPRILDLTAGLLGDSLLFLAMGCEVWAVERHPVVGFLIESALKNAKHPSIQRFHFVEQQASDILKQMPQIDVIFFDPMLEDINHKAGAKKEMRIFRELVGKDYDSAEILKIQIERVVVKRPRLSQVLIEKPNIDFKGKSTRYDVYFPKIMAQSSQIP